MLLNEPLFKMNYDLKPRWASPENPAAGKGEGGKAGRGRKGSPCFVLKSGETRTLAEEKNTSGTIRRIWITIDRRSKVFLRGIKLEFYWDKSSQPAICVPLGDFFGQGLGLMAAFESALLSSPEGNSFHCCIPMPFKTGMKITVTNESPESVNSFYYDIDYTIGDQHGEDTLYLHAFYNRQNPTQKCVDYEILPRITGKGRFLGCNIGVIANQELYHVSWWGEGEVKIYLDGDRDYPTLCGTGTEDYIGTGFGQGRFDHLYQGCSVADHARMQYCFYRLHILDPVYFQEDIRVTIQQIGCWDPSSKVHLHYIGTPIHSTDNRLMDFAKSAGSEPYGLYERSDDWSSCAYFYLDGPENNLPGLGAVEERLR